MRNGEKIVEHRCELIVRSYECDRYGHVNNAVYLNYLEYGRHEFLKAAHISINELIQAGYHLLVSKACIQYRKPVVCDDQLIILTSPVKKRKTSGVFQQQIIHADQMVADAEITWVCVDEQGRPAVLPVEFDRDELKP